MDMQKLLSIRTGNERGQAFLGALRSIMDADPQKPNQTDVIMRLVFDEAERVRKRTHTARPGRHDSA